MYVAKPSWFSRHGHGHGYGTDSDKETDMDTDTDNFQSPISWCYKVSRPNKWCYQFAAAIGKIVRRAIYFYIDSTIYTVLRLCITIQIAAYVIKKQIIRACMWFAAPSNICLEIFWRQNAFSKIEDGIFLKLRKNAQHPISKWTSIILSLLLTLVSFRWTIPLSIWVIRFKILLRGTAKRFPFLYFVKNLQQLWKLFSQLKMSATELLSQRVLAIFWQTGPFSALCYEYSSQELWSDDNCTV